MADTRYLPQADRRQYWKRCCFPNWKGENMSHYYHKKSIPFNRECYFLHSKPFLSIFQSCYSDHDIWKGGGQNGIITVNYLR